MIAGTDKQFYAMLGQVEREPNGFYRATAQDIWPGIDPYMMSRSELDKEIRAGMKLYEKYFPSGNGLSLFQVVLIVAAMAAIAVVTCGAGVAAAGAGQAAASGAAASGATATASASGALAASGPMGGAWGTGAAAASATASGTAAATTTAASFGAQAVQVAKQGASYVSQAGAVGRATGIIESGSDADKLVKGADIIESSDNVTDAGSAVFKEYLAQRKIGFDPGADEALHYRMAQEQQSYAAWMRRTGEHLQNENPDVHTSTEKSLMNWLPLATPFILLALASQ